MCVKWKFFQIEKSINLSVNCRPALPLATSLSTEPQEHRQNISMLLIQDIFFVERIKACLKWREPFTQNTANKSLVNLLTHFSQSKWYHEMITVSHNNNTHYLNSYKIFSLWWEALRSTILTTFKYTTQYHQIRAKSLEMTLMLRKTGGQEEKGANRGGDIWLASPTWWTWVEQTPGDSEGQGSLVCYSPQGCKESESLATKQQNRKL